MTAALKGTLERIHKSFKGIYNNNFNTIKKVTKADINWAKNGDKYYCINKNMTLSEKFLVGVLQEETDRISKLNEIIKSKPIKLGTECKMTNVEQFYC
jgi:hypothetical protein